MSRHAPGRRGAKGEGGVAVRLRPGAVRIGIWGRGGGYQVFFQHEGLVKDWWIMMDNINCNYNYRAARHSTFAGCPEIAGVLN